MCGFILWNSSCLTRLHFYFTSVRKSILSVKLKHNIVFKSTVINSNFLVQMGHSLFLRTERRMGITKESRLWEKWPDVFSFACFHFHSTLVFQVLTLKCEMSKKSLIFRHTNWHVCVTHIKKKNLCITNHHDSVIVVINLWNECKWKFWNLHL